MRSFVFFFFLLSLGIVRNKPVYLTCQSILPFNIWNNHLRICRFETNSPENIITIFFSFCFSKHFQNFILFSYSIDNYETKNQPQTIGYAKFLCRFTSISQEKIMIQIKNGKEHARTHSDFSLICNDAQLKKNY